MHTESLGRAGPCAVHTHSITRRTITCSCLYPHLHDTPEIYFRRHFSDAGLWTNRAWGTYVWWMLWQLFREMIAIGQLFSSMLHHHFQRQPICWAHGWGQFRPRYMHFETHTAQFTSFQRCWTFSSCKNQRFHWDTQCVASSGSHAGKSWPLAISWTVTSQPRLILWASQCLQNKERGYLGDMKC